MVYRVLQKQVLVSGAAGFVGSKLVKSLARDVRFKVTATVRPGVSAELTESVFFGILDGVADWSSALANQDVVIHTAARTQGSNETEHDALREYRKINVDGTLNLARQAARAGVQRFVFLSTIKVNGELSGDQAFSYDDSPNFHDAYSQSKYEAECGLREIAGATGMDVVIIRPPLVYGPGVKGNFKSLLGLTKRRLPLPLGLIQNRRSMVALGNLIDLISTCIEHPNAANQTFLVSDDHDLSTTELVTKLGEASGRPARTVPCPQLLFKLGAKLLGKKALADRLLGSLQVDIGHTKETLGWTPPITVEQGLRLCFEHTSKD